MPGSDPAWEPAGELPDIRPQGNEFSARVVPFIREDEELVLVSPIICVATASGLKMPGRGLLGYAAGALGDKLGRGGGVRGDPGSIAHSIPYQPNVVLGTFTDRIGLYRIGRDRPWLDEVWSAPRAVIARIERRPRLQLLARLRMHFEDGSQADFMARNGAIVDQLAQTVDRYRRHP